MLVFEESTTTDLPPFTFHPSDHRILGPFSLPFADDHHTQRHIDTRSQTPATIIRLFDISRLPSRRDQRPGDASLNKGVQLNQRINHAPSTMATPRHPRRGGTAHRRIQHLCPGNRHHARRPTTAPTYGKAVPRQPTDDTETRDDDDGK